MVIVNIKKEDSKKAFKKEAVFKVPKIKGFPMIRIEKDCDFQRNTNFSYSSQPLFIFFYHCINDIQHQKHWIFQIYRLLMREMLHHFVPLYC